MTCAFVCEAAGVEERPLERAWRMAVEERPWEPPEVWVRRWLADPLPRS